VSDRGTSLEPQAREHRPSALTRGEAARCKAVALAEAVALVADGRGMRWSRPSPLPTVAYPKVFVVGCPRSGTTWIDDIFRRHPL